MNNLGDNLLIKIIKILYQLWQYACILTKLLILTSIQIKVSVKRKRREFGAPCQFTDRNVADAKDGYIECTSYKDKTFDLQTVELDKGTQVI